MSDIRKKVHAIYEDWLTTQVKSLVHILVYIFKNLKPNIINKLLISIKKDFWVKYHDSRF